MTTSNSGQMQRRSNLIGIGLVNLATLTWAANMTLGRWLRDDIGPLTLAACRFSIASLAFLVLLQRRPAEERRLGGDWRLLLLTALTGVVLFAPTLYLGLRYTTTVNATLINGLGPLLTGVLATVLIQEPMSRRQIAGALVGLAGVIVLISDGTLMFWQTLGDNVGDLIALGAVGLWALYSVLSRKVMYHRSALSTTAFSAFLGLPWLVLAAIWEVRILPVRITPPLVLAIAFIGIVPTVGGFLAWNEGVRRLGSSGAMVFYNTLPLFGAMLGSLFLSEPIGPTHLVGGALIIGGGIYAARTP